MFIIFLDCYLIMENNEESIADTDSENKVNYLTILNYLIYIFLKDSFGTI